MSICWLKWEGKFWGTTVCLESGWIVWYEFSLFLENFERLLKWFLRKLFFLCPLHLSIACIYRGIKWNKNKTRILYHHATIHCKKTHWNLSKIVKKTFQTWRFLFPTCFHGFGMFSMCLEPSRRYPKEAHTPFGPSTHILFDLFWLYLNKNKIKKTKQCINGLRVPLTCYKHV